MEIKTLQQQLADIVQKFGEEKTFNLEALTAISDLRVGAEQLLDENKALRFRIEGLEKFKNEIEKLNQELLKKVEDYKKRESDLSDLETQKKLLLLEKTMINQRVGDIKEITALVFRNSILKYQANETVPVGENGCTAYLNKTETKEIV